MKIKIFIVCFISFFISVRPILAQKDSLKNIYQKKPYSFQLDKDRESSTIQTERVHILKQKSLNSINSSLQSKDLNIKLNAIEELGYLTDKKARILLELYLINDSSIDIRIASAKALAIIQSEKSIPVLVEALNDKNRNVGIYSAFALAVIGEKDRSFTFFSSLYEKVNIPYYSCHEGFLYIGTQAIQKYLISDMRNPDKFVAVDAAIVLAKRGFNTDAFPALVIFASNNDRYVRMAALDGLSYIGDNESLALIKSKLNDTDKLVRDRAQTILKNYNQL
jgi:HEAT repeat protein